MTKRKPTEAERRLAMTKTKLESIKAAIARLDWLAPYREEVARLEVELDERRSEIRLLSEGLEAARALRLGPQK